VEEGFADEDAEEVEDESVVCPQSATLKIKHAAVPTSLAQIKFRARIGPPKSKYNGLNLRRHLHNSSGSVWKDTTTVPQTPYGTPVPQAPVGTAAPQTPDATPVPQTPDGDAEERRFSAASADKKVSRFSACGIQRWSLPRG
jgi:hypothetical protein